MTQAVWSLSEDGGVAFFFSFLGSLTCQLSAQGAICNILWGDLPLWVSLHTDLETVCWIQASLNGLKRHRNHGITALISFSIMSLLSLYLTCDLMIPKQVEKNPTFIGRCPVLQQDVHEMS